MPIFPPALMKSLNAEEQSYVVYFSTPTHEEDGFLKSRYRKKHTLVDLPRKAFVQNRSALVGKNAYGQYLAQFDEPPQNYDWHVVDGPVDFVDEVLEGETVCESSSSAVATTRIEEE